MVSYLDQGGVQHLVDKMLDRMYPVDSIYISTNSTSPASLYGGSWERYGTGRVLVSASDTDTDFKAGTTGGSKTHDLNAIDQFYAKLAVSGLGQMRWVQAENTEFWSLNQRTAQLASIGASSNSNNSGVQIYGTATFNTQDPYVAVYIWRRTA